MRVIKRNISIEELKSRIPALFPYLEFDEFGNLVKHKATDSVDGCYGKIIPDLNGKSYRTLITEYYNGENQVIIDGDPQITVKDVIGKFDVNLDEYNETQILVPAVIYAAEAKDILDKMIKLKKSCSFASVGRSFCCECEEYNQRGGDKMVAFLESIIGEAETIANSVFDAFDDNANIVFSVNLIETIEDLGYYTSSKGLTFNGQILNDVPLACGDETHDIGELPQNIALAGLTDSKLKSLRRYSTYINDNGDVEIPQSNTDWLYFYRKGYVANYETINDNFGNISVKEGETRNGTVNAYDNNLEAYGNILYDIEMDATERTITFTYYINAHLKAKLARIEQDDDGNNIYYYKYPFEYESGGVKQTETYYYSQNGDIASLSDEDFSKLILGETEEDMDYGKRTNKKYEFFNAGGIGFYDKTIFDKHVKINYEYSSFEYERPDITTDQECYMQFKEDYLVGIHYDPSVSSAVNIQRGNNAAFERHLKLGEVKTLEDMENYQNGTFFNIQSII